MLTTASNVALARPDSADMATTWRSSRGDPLRKKRNSSMGGRGRFVESGAASCLKPVKADGRNQPAWAVLGVWRSHSPGHEGHAHEPHSKVGRWHTASTPPA